MSSFAACKTSLSAVIEIRRWSFIYTLVHVWTELHMHVSLLVSETTMLCFNIAVRTFGGVWLVLSNVKVRSRFEG